MNPAGLTFWLGVHEPAWLARAGVPLMVSRTRLARRRRLPRAAAPWVVDSGGFTELDTRGAWSITAAGYAAELRRYADEIGRLVWAAPMDWMCEPRVRAQTGLTVADHQKRTVDSVGELRALGAPVIPVLQGWSAGDYLTAVDGYQCAGIDLQAEPVIGLGSVCRRQGTDEVRQLVRELAGAGLRLHAFGAKTSGLTGPRSYADALVSADSLAWSYRARRSPPLPGCRHLRCSNCLRFALGWRSRLVTRVPDRLFDQRPHHASPGSLPLATQGTPGA